MAEFSFLFLCISNPLSALCEFVGSWTNVTTDADAKHILKFFRWFADHGQNW